MAQVWLVTGSSRGLGHAIVEAGLAAGNKVLATARDIKSLADLSERYGDQVKPFAMDVTDEAAAANAVMAWRSMYLARWMWSLTMRDMAIFRPSKTPPLSGIPGTDQKRTCFGTIIVTKRQLLGIFAKRKQASSIPVFIGGRKDWPSGTWAYYSAAKWGVEGFSEVLSRESGTARHQGHHR